MIFVTVGTHEQQFDRLVRCMDELKHDGKLQEEVFVQTGFSAYEPKFCTWEKMIPFQEMEKKIREARIVITHGGPSSFIAPLQIGKIPVVVPRRAEFGEHVNNHQVDFCNAVAERRKNIIVVNDIAELPSVIEHYDTLTASMPMEGWSNNHYFISKFEKIVDGLMQ